MKRRVFVHSVAGGVLSAPILVNQTAAQESEYLGFTIPQISNVLITSLSELSRNGEFIEEADGLVEDFTEVAIQSLSENFDEARDALSRARSNIGRFLEALSNQPMPELFSNLVPDYTESYEYVLDNFINHLEIDLGRSEETGNPVVLQVSASTLREIGRTILQERECFSPILKRLVSCSLASLPAVRTGPIGYLAVLGGCLIADLSDLGADLGVDCLPRLRERIQSLEFEYRPSYD